MYWWSLSDSGYDNDTAFDACSISSSSIRSSLNVSGTFDESAESDGNSTNISSLCSPAVLSQISIIDDSYKIDEKGGKTALKNVSTTSSAGNLLNFKIIDSTLREGEQFATAYFTTAQKLKIAKSLDEIGVEYVSVVHPVCNEFDHQYNLKKSLVNTSSIRLSWLLPLLQSNLQAEFESQSRLFHRVLDSSIAWSQILTHIRCNMDEAKIAVQTGVDGV